MKTGSSVEGLESERATCGRERGQRTFICEKRGAPSAWDERRPRFYSYSTMWDGGALGKDPRRPMWVLRGAQIERRHVRLPLDWSIL